MALVVAERMVGAPQRLPGRGETGRGPRGRSGVDGLPCPPHMLRTRQLRALWGRYAAPRTMERDVRFRIVLDEATHRGLLVAGWFGVVALLGFAVALLAYAFVGGADMVETTRALPESVLSDKLAALAASVVFLAVARLHPSTRWARALVALYVLAAGWAMLQTDFARDDLGFAAGWLTLLLLFTVGTVPFQPVQTAAVGLALTAMHTAYIALPGNADLDGAEGRRFAFLILATFVCTVMSGALYAGRNRQHRVAERLDRLGERLQRRSQQLEARTDELEAQRGTLEAQRGELSASLERLEAAQGQLVQQQKMASLGQLTAGVAHELKNPLNFVNNFAQLSTELLDEMEEELREEPQRSVGEALDASSDLLSDLRTNAAKIREHGRRADGIIRSMLAHSRATPGPRRAAAVNPLLDEYVGLSYHGMRAEHQELQVDVQKDLGPDVGEITMVPEEIGRVFLNLLDNAFAAVRERRLAEIEAGRDYAPAVTVRSRRVGGGPRGAGVEVRIGDNGTGMPEETRAHIFEPFYTTKPTGEGTGLGLSLTYEIVVHGHGGTLDVETREGEGTAFTVFLPDAPPEAPDA